MMRTEVSDIHGLGVFSSLQIDAGTEMFIEGTIVFEETHTMYKSFDLDGMQFVPCWPIRYLNHSRTPNAEVYRAPHGLMLHFLQSVAPGEEITIDYGYEP